MNTRYLLNKNKILDEERDYIEKKITKWEKYLQNQVENCAVEVDIKKDGSVLWQVEFMLKTPQKLFHVSKSGKEIMEAVDLADSSMQAQLRKENSKLKGNKR